MADTLPRPEKRKQRKSRKPINANATLYYGREVLIGSLQVELTKHAVDRLVRIEADNQRRADAFDDGIVEPVDFIAVCIEQSWRCSICGQPMDPTSTDEARQISVEHNPAMSVCHEHSRRTVEAAHCACNLKKNHAGDTTRAAKIKRVVKDEERHERNMQMKGTMTPAAIRREKLKEKIAAGNRAINSRSTFDTPSLLKLRRSESPSKWGRAGGKAWPKGRKFMGSSRLKKGQA